MKNALFVIDPQNDFCENTGSLYVPGATGDMTRLASFLRCNADKIDSIFITADDHQPNDISHPAFWVDSNGNNPAPFTSISVEDVNNKVWLPVDGNVSRAVDYLTELKAAGKYAHTIWPVHCLSGTNGADICKTLVDAVLEWAAQTKGYYSIVRKGAYPYSEHFGAFKAEVVNPDFPETMFNYKLADALNKFDKIYIAGEAKSHCVANTILQLFDTMPDLVAKLVILEDAMGCVAGFEHAADQIYETAKIRGAQFADTGLTI
ncbi:MAG: isochorismatase family protein [Bacteroidales bacterium]|nr:isochorismatase family protein [Bacteroidales bacterium]